MRHAIIAIFALAATPSHGCDPWSTQMSRDTPVSERPCRTAGEVPYGCVLRSQADCTAQQLVPLCATGNDDAQKKSVPHIGIGWYLVGCAPFDPENPPVWWRPQNDCTPIVACGLGAIDEPCASDADCASCLCDPVVGACTG